MRFEQLHEFTVLVETGNFQEAAETLAVSQATLSKHVRALEEELEVELFWHNNRKMRANEFGELFYPYAKQMLEIEATYNTALKKGSLPKKYNLKIGLSVASLCFENIERLAGLMRHNYVDVTFVRDSSMGLERRVKSRECDVALVHALDSTYGKLEFERIPFSSNRMCAILPEDHPYASNKTVSLYQLKDEQFLLPMIGSYDYGLCTKAFQKAEIQPQIVLTGCEWGHAARLVQNRFGIAFIPKIEERLPGVAVVDVLPEIHSDIELIYRKDNYSPAIYYFRMFMGKFMK